MKVVHLISGGDTGGAKTHVHSLLQGLNQSIQADLVCFTDGPFVQEARALGIRVDVMSGRNLFATLKQLKQKIESNGYNIIHCHGSRGNLMGALLRHAVKTPVVTTVHSDPKSDYMGRLFANLTFGTLNHWALHRIPYHIGVSDVITDMLIDRNIVRKNFFTIYNGVSFDNLISHHDRLEYLRSLGVQADSDSVVIGIAARLNPVKDVATLIRGFAAAYTKCPRLRLVIAGDGEERQMLEALARELNVSEQVTFAGWIEGGMDLFYSAIDINTLTSLSEAFPYALPEGSRYKLATVASNVGGIPKFINHGVDGYLFPAGDWNALAEYLIDLGNNDELRRTLGQRLYEKASADFSNDSMIRVQLEIYRKLLADYRISKNERTGVVLCGAYGRGNAGDEAILKSIVTELRSIDADMPIRVMTRSPKHTRKTYRTEAVYTFHYPAYRRMMSASKLYINGGGSLIQDVTSRRSLWFYLSTLKTARKQGCKVMMYGCGIGPVNHPTDRRYAGKIIENNVDVITLRDQHSLTELEALGVSKPRVVLAADPTVSLSSVSPESAVAMLQQAGLRPDTDQHYLGITVRPWPSFESKAPIIAAAVEYVYHTYGLIPVFIPIEARLDVTAAEQVAAHLHNIPYTILPNCAHAEQAIALFSQMDIVLSMRLHALVFSAAHGVPLVGIVYDPKVSSFLEFVEQDLHTPIESLELDILKTHLDRAAERIHDRALLEEKARKLLTLELNNLICAKELLNS